MLAIQAISDYEIYQKTFAIYIAMREHISNDVMSMVINKIQFDYFYKCYKNNYLDKSFNIIPLHIAKQLIKEVGYKKIMQFALMSNRIDIVKYMISKYKFSDLLSDACYGGHYEIIKWVIDNCYTMNKKLVIRPEYYPHMPHTNDINNNMFMVCNCYDCFVKHIDISERIRPNTLETNLIHLIRKKNIDAIKLLSKYMETIPHYIMEIAIPSKDVNIITFFGGHVITPLNVFDALMTDAPLDVFKCIYDLQQKYPSAYELFDKMFIMSAITRNRIDIIRLMVSTKIISKDSNKQSLMGYLKKSISSLNYDIFQIFSHMIESKNKHWSIIDVCLHTTVISEQKIRNVARFFNFFRKHAREHTNCTECSNRVLSENDNDRIWTHATSYDNTKILNYVFTNINIRDNIKPKLLKCAINNNCLKSLNYFIHNAKFQYDGIALLIYAIDCASFHRCPKIVKYIHERLVFAHIDYAYMLRICNELQTFEYLVNASNYNYCIDIIINKFTNNIEIAKFIYEHNQKFIEEHIDEISKKISFPFPE